MNKNLDTLHVVPVNDIKMHIMSLSCKCSPRIDMEESQLIGHYSFDGREFYEDDNFEHEDGHLVGWGWDIIKIAASK